MAIRYFQLLSVASGYFVGLMASSPVMAEPPISLQPGPSIIGSEFDYTVQPGDYLIKIGARFGVAAEVLARENGLRYEAVMKPGQKLVIRNYHIVPGFRQDGVVINLPQRILYLFRSGELQGAYPVGLGKPSWPTPTGDFTIIEKKVNKTWVVPKSIQEEMQREGQVVRTHVPPGPDNPLGKHWLGLSIQAIGIHSTIAPASIYHFQSHGCIRQHPDDVARLFDQVAVGESGSIIYAPVLLAESDGKIFLEVHRDIYEAADVSLETVRKMARELMLINTVDWEKAAEVINRHEGVARDVTWVTGANVHE